MGPLKIPPEHVFCVQAGKKHYELFTTAYVGANYCGHCGLANPFPPQHRARSRTPEVPGPYDEVVEVEDSPPPRPVSPASQLLRDRPKPLSSISVGRTHMLTINEIFEEVPVPKVSPTGVLCKVLASGVCRSDHSLLTIDKQASWFEEKYTLGHEGCGQIVQLGSAVHQDKFQVGDIVALHAVPGCGRQDCPQCSRDLSQLCEKGHHSGIGQDGFYAPYAAVDIRGVAKVPSGVTPAQAAVATDAVNTAYHAIRRRAEANAHETVFLFGLGGLGFNALQILLHIGPKIIVSDIRQERLDEAQKLGIPPCDIVPIGASPQEFTTGAELDGKIDTVMDFVGTHQTFKDAQHIVRRGGMLICIGSLDTENTIHMKIGTVKRLSYIFSYGGQVRDLVEVLQLIADGSITPQVETSKLAEFPRVLESLVRGEVRARVALTHG